MQTKVCSGCGKDKSVGDFYAHPTGRFGVGERCKSCHLTAVADRKAEKLKVFWDLNAEGVKECVRCGGRKPLEEFGPNKSGKDGRFASCRKCLKRPTWEERLASGEIDSIPTTRFCNKCGNEKPLEFFHKQINGPFGRKTVCMECHKQFYRITAETNRSEKRRSEGWEKPTEGDKWCPDCETYVSVTNFQSDIKRADGLASRCKPCNNAFRTKCRRNLRIEVLSYYSDGQPACACCGEDIFEFLCIDHIDGGGAKHRREIGFGSETLYKWLKGHGYPEGFRVLCQNCNMALAHHGTCPHQRNKI